MKIGVTGGSGMLGRRVVAEALQRGHDVLAPSHEACPVESLLAQYYFQGSPSIPNDWGRAEVVINCAGVVPPDVFHPMIMVNSLGPWNLAVSGIRLVHMSTDCVFSGQRQQRYIPSTQIPDPVDVYGRSKRAGEPLGSPLEKVLVVRGSFIGPERGFLRWLLDADGPATTSWVWAWTKAYWNGSSSAQMAKVLVDLAEGERVGVVHVGAEEPVSKAWMIEYLAEALHLRFNIQLTPEPAIWRALEPEIVLPPVARALDELVAEIKVASEGRRSARK